VPYCVVKPAWNSGLGPHVSFYRITMDGEEEHVLTFGAGGVTSLVRWLPLVITAARRIGARSNPSSKTGQRA
jgi:hypothetical protein